MPSEPARDDRPDKPTMPDFPEITKFDELIQHNLVHPVVVEQITKGMGHHTMTQVQSMTINQALHGSDM